MICEECGKEHDGSYGSGRFCSDHCRRVWIGRHSIQKRKQNGTFISGFAISKTHGRSKKAPYGTWKCQHCNYIAQTKGELQIHIHDTHARHDNYGNPIIWNKDLTLKDNKSLQKANKTLKDGYRTGRLKAWNKHKKHSEEEIRKIRISTVNYLLKTKHIKQPRYNIDSIQFFDNLSKEKGWNLQHAENGGEFYTGIGYFVDAYDKNNFSSAVVKAL